MEKDGAGGKPQRCRLIFQPRIETPLAVNTAGEPLSSAPLFGQPVSRYRPIDAALRGGTVVNHYATRSTDTFLMKQARGRGMGPASNKYTRNSTWHRRANRNDVQDRSILRRWPEVAAELTRLRALPGVAQAEANCGVSDLPAMPTELVEKLRRHNWRRAFWYGGK